MEHPGFFHRAGPFTLAKVAGETGATLGDPVRGGIEARDIRSLAEAGAADIAFVDNPRYLQQLQATRAAACFVQPKFQERVPAGTVALLTPEPYRAYAKALVLFYPDAGIPKAGWAVAPGEGGAQIHPTARLEPGVIVEPGAVIGEAAAIGTGTRIAAGAVIGYSCTVGRNCFIGPRAVIAHALIGNDVIIHAGVAIGQDGFGFAMGREGHLKVRQIGRVIIQDHVEIGANTTIDRGALRDTIIGEGTKIDNLVQIGHNVVIGRHCVLAGMVGIAGSAVLEDFVVVGGQGGVAGHLTVGAGAQIAGRSGVTDNVPRGERWAGTPAKPLREFGRELALIKRLAAKLSSKDMKTASKLDE